MKRETEEMLKGAEKRGELKEARKSLLRRFTENELAEVINIVWFSPQMQSIRDRLGKLEKEEKAPSDAVKQLKEKTPETVETDEKSDLCERCKKEKRSGPHATMCVNCRRDATQERIKKSLHSRFPHIYDEHGEKYTDKKSDMGKQTNEEEPKEEKETAKATETPKSPEEAEKPEELPLDELKEKIKEVLRQNIDAPPKEIVKHIYGDQYTAKEYSRVFNHYDTLRGDVRTETPEKAEKEETKAEYMERVEETKPKEKEEPAQELDSIDYGPLSSLMAVIKQRHPTNPKIRQHQLKSVLDEQNVSVEKFLDALQTEPFKKKVEETTGYYFEVQDSDGERELSIKEKIG